MRRLLHAAALLALLLAGSSVTAAPQPVADVNDDKDSTSTTKKINSFDEIREYLKQHNHEQFCPQYITRMHYAKTEVVRTVVTNTIKPTTTSVAYYTNTILLGEYGLKPDTTITYTQETTTTVTTTSIQQAKLELRSSLPDPAILQSFSAEEISVACYQLGGIKTYTAFTTASKVDVTQSAAVTVTLKTTVNYAPTIVRTTTKVHTTTAVIPECKAWNAKCLGASDLGCCDGLHCRDRYPDGFVCSVEPGPKVCGKVNADCGKVGCCDGLHCALSPALDKWTCAEPAPQCDAEGDRCSHAGKAGCCGDLSCMWSFMHDGFRCGKQACIHQGGGCGMSGANGKCCSGLVCQYGVCLDPN